MRRINCHTSHTRGVEAKYQNNTKTRSHHCHKIKFAFFVSFCEYISSLRCWHLNIQIEINIFVLYLHHRNTQMIWIHTEENIFYICTQRQDTRLDTDTDHLGPTLASPHPSDCSSWHPGPGASTEGRSTQTHWHCPHSLGSSSSSSSSSSISSFGTLRYKFFSSNSDSAFWKKIIWLWFEKLCFEMKTFLG